MEQNTVEVKSRNRLIVLFSLAILSFSCERQYDQSDPINTLKAYIDLNNQGNYDEAYKLFSDSSKLRITEHEFSLYQKTSKRLSADSIYMTFMNPLRPNFRNYEISNKMENTVSDEHGVSNIVVSKEEEIWKVLWLETLIDSESSRLVKTRENFSTRNLFALGVINPICRRCNELIAWDYIGNDDLKNAKYYFQKAEEISPNTVDPLLATLYYSLNGDSLIALNWSKRIWSGEGSKRFLTEIRFLEIIDKLLDKGYVTLTKDLIEVATLWYPESLDIIEKKAEIYHKLVLGYSSPKHADDYFESDSQDYYRKRYNEAFFSFLSSPISLQSDSTDQLDVLKSFFQEFAIPYLSNELENPNHEQIKAYQTAFIENMLWCNFEKSPEQDTLKRVLSGLSSFKKN